MKKFIYITGILALLFSCKKDKLEDDKSILIGRWIWRYTDHEFGWCEGLAQHERLTQESQHEDYSIEFEKKGVIKFYINNEIKEECRLVFNNFRIDTAGLLSFGVYLNNKKDNTFYGGTFIGGGSDSMYFKYPFTTTNYSCENYTNYFVRE